LTACARMHETGRGLTLIGISPGETDR
jgi:hypothetical protein